MFYNTNVIWSFIQLLESGKPLMILCGATYFKKKKKKQALLYSNASFEYCKTRPEQSRVD